MCISKSNLVRPTYLGENVIDEIQVVIIDGGPKIIIWVPPSNRGQAIFIFIFFLFSVTQKQATISSESELKRKAQHPRDLYHL